MKQTKLKVSQRDSFGSAEARRMRKQGLIPGVLYGAGSDSVSLQVEEKALRQAVGHERGGMILNLTFEGKDKSQLAMLKDYQRDPISGSVTHLDFIEVKMDQPLESTAMIELIGKPAGLRDGGIMDHALREVHIRSLPQDMPSHIECNVEALNIGDSIRISDLQVPDGVEILADPEAMVAIVIAPRVVTEEVTEEGEAALEEGAAAAEKAAEGEGAGE